MRFARDATRANEIRAWRERILSGTGEYGYAVVPRHPSLDPRCTPHPLATYLQRIQLSGAEQTVPRREYV